VAEGTRQRTYVKKPDGERGVLAKRLRRRESVEEAEKKDVGRVNQRRTGVHYENLEGSFNRERPRAAKAIKGLSQAIDTGTGIWSSLRRGKRGLSQLRWEETEVFQNTDGREGAPKEDGKKRAAAPRGNEQTGKRKGQREKNVVGKNGGRGSKRGTDRVRKELHRIGFAGLGRRKGELSPKRHR